ncbi:MAG: LysR family transcriptional regulator [Sneathiella sp.]|nr:LysR family transcriptional regulator [Sneathiella sp.]
MLLDPKHLLLLAEIYDSGGFSEAAASLGTSQPGLSRVIKSLEERIEEPLFSRTRKPLELTPIGKRLVDQGRAIRNATKRASESVDRIRSGDEGEIRIGGTPFFMDGFMSSLFAEFQATRPNIKINITHGYPDDLINQLAGDRIDAAICPVSALDPNRNLDFRPLIRGHNLVACRVGHPLRSKKNLTAIDLLDYPWVAPPPHSPLSEDLKNALSSIEASNINIAASGGGLGSVVNYIVHTDYLTILPHTVVFALRRQGTLSALPIEINHPNRTLGFLTPKQGAIMPAVEKLSDFLSVKIQEMLKQIREHESAVMETK